MINLFLERSKIPNKGLRNLGNTCYINALLQCLYHVESFQKYIIEVQEQQGLPLLGIIFTEIRRGLILFKREACKFLYCNEE